MLKDGMLFLTKTTISVDTLHPSNVKLIFVKEFYTGCWLCTSISISFSLQMEQTQWDHPKLVDTMNYLCEFNEIKFSAYRTAMKLRAVQKRLFRKLAILLQSKPFCFYFRRVLLKIKDTCF